MRIWPRYLTREFLKVFLLFIFSFYFLYVLIDYSSRLEHFSSIYFSSILLHYLFIFSQKAELLIPFAFMVSLIKILFSVNQHNELTSMLMSGFSYKRLLSPLLWIALSLTALLYFNFEFFEPLAQKKIEMIKQEKNSKKEKRIKSFVLEDRTKLVFRKFNLARNSLEEVYWIKSPDEIYYMSELYPFSTPPIGHYVSEFLRDSNDDFELTSRKDMRPFNEMSLEFDPVIQSVFSVRTYSVSALIHALHDPKALLNINDYELLTLLNYKLLLPLLPILLYFVFVPICTRFSRSIPIFFVYMLSIGGLLSFFTLMDACYFLGETKVAPPQIIIWAPALLYFLYPIKRFLAY